MTGSQCFRRAAHVLHNGGIIAYPTEGVFGLGCRPDDINAVKRILDIKSRNISKGLILIASDVAQLSEWADLSEKELTTSNDKPVTWIVPATDEVPDWIRGSHASIAVRLTTHPTARAICASAESSIVSTSANFSGRTPVRNRHVLRRQFGPLVDYIVPGRCGPAAGASEMRDYLTGDIVRPA